MPCFSKFLFYLLYLQVHIEASSLWKRTHNCDYPMFIDENTISGKCPYPAYLVSIGNKNRVYGFVSNIPICTYPYGTYTYTQFCALACGPLILPNNSNFYINIPGFDGRGIRPFEYEEGTIICNNNTFIFNQKTKRYSKHLTIPIHCDVDPISLFSSVSMTSKCEIVNFFAHHVGHGENFFPNSSILHNSILPSSVLTVNKILSLSSPLEPKDFFAKVSQIHSNNTIYNFSDDRVTTWEGFLDDFVPLLASPGYYNITLFFIMPDYNIDKIIPQNEMVEHLLPRVKMSIGSTTIQVVSPISSSCINDVIPNPLGLTREAAFALMSLTLLKGISSLDVNIHMISEHNYQKYLLVENEITMMHEDTKGIILHAVLNYYSAAGDVTTHSVKCHVSFAPSISRDILICPRAIFTFSEMSLNYLDAKIFKQIPSLLALMLYFPDKPTETNLLSTVSINLTPAESNEKPILLRTWTGHNPLPASFFEGVIYFSKGIDMHNAQISIEVETGHDFQPVNFQSCQSKLLSQFVSPKAFTNCSIECYFGSCVKSEMSDVCHCWPLYPYTSLPTNCEQSELHAQFATTRGTGRLPLTRVIQQEATINSYLDLKTLLNNMFFDHLELDNIFPFRSTLSISLVLYMSNTPLSESSFFIEDTTFLENIGSHQFNLNDILQNVITQSSRESISLRSLFHDERLHSIKIFKWNAFIPNYSFPTFFLLKPSISLSKSKTVTYTARIVQPINFYISLRDINLEQSDCPTDLYLNSISVEGWSRLFFQIASQLVNAVMLKFKPPYAAEASVRTLTKDKVWIELTQFFKSIDIYVDDQFISVETAKLKFPFFSPEIFSSHVPTSFVSSNHVSFTVLSYPDIIPAIGLGSIYCYNLPFRVIDIQSSMPSPACTSYCVSRLSSVANFDINTLLLQGNEFKCEFSETGAEFVDSPSCMCIDGFISQSVALHQADGGDITTCRLAFQCASEQLISLFPPLPLLPYTATSPSILLHSVIFYSLQDIVHQNLQHFFRFSLVVDDTRGKSTTVSVPISLPLSLHDLHDLHDDDISHTFSLQPFSTLSLAVSLSSHPPKSPPLLSCTIPVSLSPTLPLYSVNDMVACASPLSLSSDLLSANRDKFQSSLKDIIFISIAENLSSVKSLRSTFPGLPWNNMHELSFVFSKFKDLSSQQWQVSIMQRDLWKQDDFRVNFEPTKLPSEEILSLLIQVKTAANSFFVSACNVLVQIVSSCQVDPRMNSTFPSSTLVNENPVELADGAACACAAGLIPSLTNPAKCVPNSVRVIELSSHGLVRISIKQVNEAFEDIFQYIISEIEDINFTFLQGNISSSQIYQFFHPDSEHYGTLTNIQMITLMAVQKFIDNFDSLLNTEYSALFNDFEIGSDTGTIVVEFISNFADLLSISEPEIYLPLLTNSTVCLSMANNLISLLEATHKSMNATNMRRSLDFVGGLLLAYTDAENFNHQNQMKSSAFRDQRFLLRAKYYWRLSLSTHSGDTLMGIEEKEGQIEAGARKDNNFKLVSDTLSRMSLLLALESDTSDPLSLSIDGLSIEAFLVNLDISESSGTIVSEKETKFIPFLQNNTESTIINANNTALPANQTKYSLRNRNLKNEDENEFYIKKEKTILNFQRQPQSAYQYCFDHEANSIKQSKSYLLKTNWPALSSLNPNFASLLQLPLSYNNFSDTSLQYANVSSSVSNDDSKFVYFLPNPPEHMISLNLAILGCNNKAVILDLVGVNSSNPIHFKLPAHRVSLPVANSNKSPFEEVANARWLKENEPLLAAAKRVGGEGNYWLHESSSKIFRHDGVSNICVWWSFQSQRWETSNCTSKFDEANDVLECYCTHLTDFGSLVADVSTSINFDLVLFELVNLEWKVSNAVLWFVVSIILLWASLGVRSILLDRLYKISTEVLVHTYLNDSAIIAVLIRNRKTIFQSGLISAEGQKKMQTRIIKTNESVNFNNKYIDGSRNTTFKSSTQLNSMMENIAGVDSTSSLSSSLSPPSLTKSFPQNPIIGFSDDNTKRQSNVIYKQQNTCSNRFSPDENLLCCSLGGKSSLSALFRLYCLILFDVLHSIQLSIRRIRLTEVCKETSDIQLIRCLDVSSVDVFSDSSLSYGSDRGFEVKFISPLPNNDLFKFIFLSLFQQYNFSESPEVTHHDKFIELHTGVHLKKSTKLAALKKTVAFCRRLSLLRTYRAACLIQSASRLFLKRLNAQSRQMKLSRSFSQNYDKLNEYIPCSLAQFLKSSPESLPPLPFSLSDHVSISIVLSRLSWVTWSFAETFAVIARRDHPLSRIFSPSLYRSHFDMFIILSTRLLGLIFVIGLFFSFEPLTPAEEDIPIIDFGVRIMDVPMVITIKSIFASLMASLVAGIPSYLFEILFSIRTPFIERLAPQTSFLRVNVEQKLFSEMYFYEGNTQIHKESVKKSLNIPSPKQSNDVFLIPAVSLVTPDEISGWLRRLKIRLCITRILCIALILFYIYFIIGFSAAMPISFYPSDFSEGEEELESLKPSYGLYKRNISTKTLNNSNFLQSNTKELTEYSFPEWKIADTRTVLVTFLVSICLNILLEFFFIPLVFAFLLTCLLKFSIKYSSSIDWIWNVTPSTLDFSAELMHANLKKKHNLMSYLFSCFPCKDKNTDSAYFKVNSNSLLVNDFNIGSLMDFSTNSSLMSTRMAFNRAKHE